MRINDNVLRFMHTRLDEEIESRNTPRKFQKMLWQNRRHVSASAKRNSKRAKRRKVHADLVVMTKAEKSGGGRGGFRRDGGGFGGGRGGRGGEGEDMGMGGDDGDDGAEG